MTKRLITLSVVLAVLLVLGVIGFVTAREFLPGLLAKLPFAENNQVIDFHEYFALDPAVSGLVVEDTRVVAYKPPEWYSDELYLPVSFVRDYMDEFLFWDEYAKTLFLTTDTDVLRFTPGSPDYTVNDEKQSLKTSAVRKFNGEAYIPAELVSQLYPYDITFESAFKMAVVLPRDNAKAKGTAAAAKKTGIRYRPDAKSPVEYMAAKGDVFTLYEEDGEFTRIRTADGLLGYVKTSLLTQVKPADAAAQTEDVDAAKANPLWPAGVKINMMWEAAYNPDANRVNMETPLPDGVNVLSPTWFYFDEETLTLLSRGSREYADWAHAQDCQVWGMVADGSGTISHGMLTDVSLRKRVVTQLAEYAEEYDLDGINIDFEHVREEDGAYYIQFLRELAPVLRRSGVILSVDVYVPSAWSMYYRRDQIAKTADFVAVMAYDEHYPGSASIGPTASLPFVWQGVQDMLQEVPKEQLLLGLPFYNRIWRVIVNNDTPDTRKTQHFGIDRTKRLLADQNAEPEWDPLAGTYKAEYAAVEEDEVVMYHIWLEDEHSIAEKLKIFESEELAGVAGWYRGLENEAVQELLRQYCK